MEQMNTTSRNEEEIREVRKNLNLWLDVEYYVESMIFEHVVG